MDREGLAKKIKARRLHLGISISAAGRAAGVHRLTWRGWEHGVLPEEHNFVRVESVLRWLPGGVRLALVGQDPINVEDEPEPGPDPLDIDEEALQHLLRVRAEFIALGATPQQMAAALDAVQRFYRGREPDEDRWLRTRDRFLEEAARLSLETERDNQIGLGENARPFE